MCASAVTHLYDHMRKAELERKPLRLSEADKSLPSRSSTGSSTLSDYCPKLKKARFEEHKEETKTTKTTTTSFAPSPSFSFASATIAPVTAATDNQGRESIDSALSDDFAMTQQEPRFDEDGNLIEDY